jgi:hypothetical protein
VALPASTNGRSPLGEVDRGGGGDAMSIQHPVDLAVWALNLMPHVRAEEASTKLARFALDLLPKANMLAAIWEWINAVSRNGCCPLPPDNIKAELQRLCDLLSMLEKKGRPVTDKPDLATAEDRQIQEAQDELFDLCQTALRTAEVDIRRVKIEYDSMNDDPVAVQIDMTMTVSLDANQIVMRASSLGVLLGFLEKDGMWTWREFFFWPGMANDLSPMIAPRGWAALVREEEGLPKGQVDGLDEIVKSLDETVELERASYVPPDKIELVLLMKVKSC